LTAAEILKTIGTHVVPLSSNKHVADSSAIGASVVKLFPDLNTAASEKNVWMQTSADCLTLATRFFAVEWDFCYEHHTLHRPHSQERCYNLGKELKPFAIARDVCAAPYLGGAGFAEGHFHPRY